jgi:hypothetical protein
MNRLAAQCQALKGQGWRRGAARIESRSTQLARERIDHPPRPPIEWIGPLIPCLAGILKYAPLSSAREAEQNERARYPPRKCVQLVRPGMKGATYRKT